MSGHVDGFLNVGGVNFQRDAIKENRFGLAVAGPFIKIVSKPDEDFRAEMRYSVTLNDGTIVEYPEQPKGNKANIMFSTHGDYQNPKKVCFSYIQGLEITDTPKDDNYEVRSCDDVNINAKREEVIRYGHALGPGIVYHEYERTRSEDKDKIRVIGGDNVNVEYTSGFDTVEIKTNAEIEKNQQKLTEEAKKLLSE